MLRSGLLVALAAIVLAPAALAAKPAQDIAVFDFQFIDTSPAPPSPEEIARTKSLGDTLRDLLAKSGEYKIISIAPVEAAVEAGSAIRDCNGCEVDYGHKLGAHLVAYGWIQKVSNLILNINLVIEDVDNNKTVTAASVDIRGNTDESWYRGLKFMLDDRVLDQ